MNTTTKIASLLVAVAIGMIDLNAYSSELAASKQREVSSEEVVPRGSPENMTAREITVYVPENAYNIRVEAFMKNEPWGGSQHPPKPDTDDMKTTEYFECPMGSGECPIGWAKVGPATRASLPNGRTRITAVFWNWVGRNDRTAKLVATYEID